MTIKRLSNQQVKKTAKQLASSDGALTYNGLSLCAAVIIAQSSMLRQQQSEIQRLDELHETSVDEIQDIEALENDLNTTTETLAELRDAAAEALVYGDMTDLKRALVASSKIELDSNHAPFTSNRTDGYLLSVIGTH